MVSTLELYNGNIITVDNYNDHFIILKSPEEGQLLGLAKFLHSNELPFIEEIIGSETEICIKLKESYNIKLLNNAIQNFQTIQPICKTYRLPVYFSNHEDWLYIENYTKLKREEYIDILLGNKFKIAFFGFLPGFAYITGLPKLLSCPRKTNPSKKIAPFSFAVGNQYLGTYSIESPGGWHVIGEFGTPIINVPNTPPVLLNQGDVIIIDSITNKDLIEIRNNKLNILDYNDKY